ncbi:hypothetical protein ACFX1Z_037286 [Malus domestica]
MHTVVAGGGVKDKDDEQRCQSKLEKALEIKSFRRIINAYLNYSPPPVVQLSHRHDPSNPSNHILVLLLDLLGQVQQRSDHDFISDIRAGGIIWSTRLKHPHVSDASLSFMSSSVSE